MLRSVTAKIIQILEGVTGETYRLRLRLPKGVEYKAELLSIQSPNGKWNANHPITLEARTSKHGCTERIVSFVVDPGLVPFSVLYDKETILKIDKRHHDDICHERDMRMVNPGIDGLYTEWLRAFQEEQMRLWNRQDAHSISPLMSIVIPIYETPESFLRDVLDSVVAQTYKNWELVLVNASPNNKVIREVLSNYDDRRIRMIQIQENLGIAGNTNVGIEAAAGDYVLFVDHDDMIEPTLLSEYVSYIEDHPDVAIIYCDEDTFTTMDGRYHSVQFKPDFNEDFLLSHNYIVHCLAVSRDFLEVTPRSANEVSGVQDYDILLNGVLRNAMIGHVPKVLYHWREHEGSTNGGLSSAKPYVEMATKSLFDTFYRKKKLDIEVLETTIPYFYEIRFNLSIDLHSIVVVFRGIDNLLTTMSALARATDPHRTEFIMVGSVADMPELDDATVVESLDSLSVHSKLVISPDAYDFGRAVNQGVFQSTGEVISVCRDNVAEVDAQSLRDLIGWSLREEIGACAPCVLYPDGFSQNCGLYIDEGKVLYPNQNLYPAFGGGYLGSANYSCDRSAIGPDFLTFCRAKFDQVGGFESFGESALMGAVDFCFRLREANMRAAYVPLAKAVCYEHVIEEGIALSPVDEAAEAMLWERWGEGFKQDIFFNPNVIYSSGYPRLNVHRYPDVEASADSPLVEYLYQKKQKLLKRVPWTR